MSNPDVITAKAQRWALLVADHTASFREVIRLAAQHPRDTLLAGYGRRAEAGLHALEAENAAPRISETSPYGSLGEWGRNGRGPQIDMLVRGARSRAAELSARAVKVAA